VTPPISDAGYTLTNTGGRIYVECETCQDGANGPNNRHGAATIQAFTTEHEETHQ
jgi:hypothetical protein